MGFNCLKAIEPYEETVCVLPISLQEVLEFIWSTLEGWEAKLLLEPPSGFELRTQGFGIQCLNQQGIFRSKFSDILKPVTSLSILRYLFLKINLLLFIQCCSFIHQMLLGARSGLGTKSDYEAPRDPRAKISIINGIISNELVRLCHQ